MSWEAEGSRVSARGLQQLAIQALLTKPVLMWWQVLL